MKIPLSAVPYDELNIFTKGKNVKVNFPFKPFIYAEREYFKEELDGKVEVFTKLPENIETEYIKQEFNTIGDMYNFLKKTDKKKYLYHNGYLEQIVISDPEFFYKYPHDEKITIMYYDIEVATKGDGMFPKPISTPILCIGYSIWEYYPDGNSKKIKMKDINNFDRENLCDKDIINEFLNDVQECNPDIIADYNGDTFDFPYIGDRCEINGIDTAKLGRTGRPATLEKNNIKIPGRIHFDLFNSNSGVVKDQKLYGLKNKGLKELARFYNADIEDIELEHEIEDLLKLYDEDRDRLKAYMRDDILRTEHVGHVYIRNCITLAEFIGIPLDNIINMYSSLVPKLFVARSMLSRKYMNTRSNFQKYNLINGMIAKIGTTIEGAIVGLFKDGFWSVILKLDFAGMYPSALDTFNLGPDTTTLVKTEPFSGKFNFKVVGNYNWYRIPDKNFNVDLIIKVRNDITGFLKDDLSNLRDQRNKIKKELKNYEHGDPMYNSLDSQQNAIKVVMNSAYGLMGLESSIYGDMITAAMVTGMCRWTTGKVIEKYQDIILQLDTDGVIISEEVDVDEANKYLYDLIYEKLNIKDSCMILELEESGRAYFYAMKNYVLEEEGRYIKHGVSLKGSKKAGVVDRAVDLAIQHIFNNKPVEEVIKEAYDFNGLDINEFTERMSIKKELVEYDNPLCNQIFLAKQIEMKTGQVVTKNTQLNYVITKDRLPYKELQKYYKNRNYAFIKFVDSIDQIDHTYYINLIDKELAKFGIYKIKQCDLFGDVFKTSRKQNLTKLEDVIPKEM